MEQNFDFAKLAKNELQLIKEFLQKRVDEAQNEMQKLAGVIIGLKMAFDRASASLDAIEKTEAQAQQLEKKLKRIKNATE